MTFQQQFLAAYIASKPPAVRALWPVVADGFDDNARQAIVSQLVAQGYILDNQIDVWNWDPMTTMLVRTEQGMTTVPAYNNAGTIKVSILLSDYPPFPTPPPNVVVTPPIPKVANPVGAPIGIPNWYRCAVAQDGYGLGDTWTGTAFGATGTWTKTAEEAGIMIIWIKTA